MTYRFGIFLFLSVLLCSCKREYKVEGSNVYFIYWNEGSGDNKWLIDSAEGKTFQSLDLKCDCNFTFGKDKKSLFIDGIQMKGIDPNSFTFFGNYIFKDKFEFGKIRE
ncbi:DKNYY domain-containing protein [Flavitalea flava]